MLHHRRTLKLRLALLCTASVLISSGALGQTWPSRPIEMVIPFPPGGGTDLVGRSMAAALSGQLGRNVFVTNREGAGGTLGMGNLASASRDGHSIAFSPTTPITNAPYLMKGVQYQVDSFDYICQVFENVFTIAVGPNSKFISARDLLSDAGKNPGKLTYGHSGAGTIPHLSVENLAESLQLKFTGVPFRGDSAILPVLLKGDIDFAAVGASTLRGHQNFRVLAVFADKPHPSFADRPTAKDLGVPASVPPGHNGIFAPKGLPGAVRSSLERSCATAVRSSAVIQAVENTGQTISYLTGEQFHAQTVEDYKFKGELVRRLGLASR